MASALLPAQPSHLLHVMAGFGVGGIQVRLARIINALGARYRHTIFSLDGNTACRDRLDPALPVTIATPDGAGRPLPARLAGCRAALASEAPALLLTYNWGAIEWAVAQRLFGRSRHIHFEDGFGPEEAEAQLWRRALFRRLALARTEAVVVPSRTLEAVALGSWHLAPRQVRYIPNGIDGAAFLAESRDEPPLFARRADDIVIGTVAPLRPEKNLGRLIRAFATLPGGGAARLVIAGSGPERPHLEALAQASGAAARILFLGAVAQPQRALRLFDIFALTSDTEQMPMTVLEAMAAALPVAALDVGDVRPMLAPENRPLVAARGSEEGLQAALARLVGDGALRRALGAANAAHVRQAYPWQGLVDSYDRLFMGGSGAL